MRRSCNLLIYLSVILASLLALTGPFPARSVEQWRQIAIAARKSAYKEEYAEAISGFLKALSASRTTGQSVDVLCNLKLSLSEVYCRAGRFEECQRVLESVKNEIDNASAIDPTLGVRYWRRVSELALRQKRFKESDDASAKAIETFSRVCHDHDRYRYLDAWQMHLKSLSHDPTANLAGELVRFAREHAAILSSPTLARQRFGYILEAYSLSKPPEQVNFSTKDIDYLAQFANPNQTLSMMIAFLRGWRLHDVEPYLDKIENTIKHGGATVDRKCDCQFVLLVYLQQQPPPNSQDRLLKVLDTFDSDDRCSRKQLELKLSAMGQFLVRTYQLAGYEAERARKLPSFERLCLNIVNLHRSDPYHEKCVEARLYLALVQVKAGRLAEAASALEPLRAVTARSECSPAVRYWASEIHVMLGEAFVRRGDLKQAKTQWSLATSGIAKTPASYRKALEKPLAALNLAISQGGPANGKGKK